MSPQVLVLGMPRTGTQSICQALNTLGYPNAYHMTTVGPNGHHDKWVAALEAKFEGKGAEFGKKEFEELLHNFDVVSDIPSSIFYEELMTAYPSAHIILTTRDEDAWFESMSMTLNLAYTKAKAEPSKLAKLYNLHLWGDDFLARGREAFRSHNAAVLRAAEARGRPVLVFNPAQGWKSLCAFLGKPVPEGVAYPRKDMWVGYKQMVKEVEAGRLTENAITIMPQRPANGVLRGDGKGIKSAYNYTQQKEGDLLPTNTGEGINSAYIYTQQKEGDLLPTNTVEGINSAYIYTQQKEGDLLPTNTGEGINSAYIYTQQKEGDLLPTNTGEGINSAYIYTQQKEGDLLPTNTGEGINSAYIYTQQKEGDLLPTNTGEGINSAYIYTQQKENGILVPSTNEGMKAAYISTQ